MNNATREWKALLGERARTDVEQYSQNLTEFPKREVSAVLHPVSVEEVQQITKIAAKYRSPLYPISTGRNWGLGSRLPVQDGCTILDLGRMNCILEINEEFQYAVIEPGVTQQQLADALAHTRYMLSVTGSSGHTSVLGNILERGVGILGQRTRELRGVEAILADGQLIRTGNWQIDDENALHHYIYGAGPDVTGLFMQSNLGIVTKVVVGLHLRRNAEIALICSTDASLEHHIDTLHRLRSHQLIQDRIEVNSENDPRLSGMSKNTRSGEWMTWIALWARGLDLSLLKGELSSHFSSISYFSPKQSELPGPVQSRFRKLSGQPGDEYIDAMAGYPVNSCQQFSLDNDPSFPGFVCVLPAIPFTGRHVFQAISIVTEIDKELGVASNLTFNSVGEHSMEGFFRLSFDRTSERGGQTAHRWARRTQETLADNGFYPMRTSVQNMYYQSGHRSMLSLIKQAVDPEGIISPGRYISP